MKLCYYYQHSYKMSLNKRQDVYGYKKLSA